MSSSSPLTSTRRVPRRSRARSLGVRIAAALVLAAFVFVLGVALGMALHDNPKPGGSVTQVRTLRPLPLAPARETVTVTVRTS